MKKWMGIYKVVNGLDFQGLNLSCVCVRTLCSLTLVWQRYENWYYKPMNSTWLSTDVTIWGQIVKTKINNLEEDRNWHKNRQVHRSI